MPRGNCVVNGCPKIAYYGPTSMCVMHLRRWERGRPLDAPEEKRGLPLRERFYQHVVVQGADECWPWTGPVGRGGYGVFGLRQEEHLAHPGITSAQGGGPQCNVFNAYTHRVAFFLEYGEPPAGLGCHTCDNPPCCNPFHIYDGTYQTNADDCTERGRRPVGDQCSYVQRARGERAGLAKLTEVAVRDIRIRYAAGGISQQALADEYGVHQSKISDVIRRKTWAHV